MRLHASILCSSAGTPVSALAFQKKVTSYYKILGLSDAALSFKELTDEQLVSHILTQWEAREKTRAMLATKIPELIHEADRSAAAVALMARGTSPADALRCVTESSSASKAA